MQKYDVIDNAIANNDIHTLRETIGSICYTCRDFSDGEFMRFVNYAERKGIKLKDDKLVGNPTISSQKSSYTDEDFARAVFELKKNFCDERIADVKRIGKELYGTKKVNSSPERAFDNSRSENGIKIGMSPNGKSHPQKSGTLAVGVVAVIILTAIVFLLLNR